MWMKRKRSDCAILQIAAKAGVDFDADEIQVGIHVEDVVQDDGRRGLLGVRVCCVSLERITYHDPFVLPQAISHHGGGATVIAADLEAGFPSSPALTASIAPGGSGRSHQC